MRKLGDFPCAPEYLSQSCLQLFLKDVPFLTDKTARIHVTKTCGMHNFMKKYYQSITQHGQLYKSCFITADNASCFAACLWILGLPFLSTSWMVILTGWYLFFSFLKVFSYSTDFLSVITPLIWKWAGKKIGVGWMKLGALSTPKKLIFLPSDLRQASLLWRILQLKSGFFFSPILRGEGSIEQLIFYTCYVI